MYVQWPAEKAIAPKNTGTASSETQRKHYILLTKKGEEWRKWFSTRPGRKEL
jgi:hypothetical protein